MSKFTAYVRINADSKQLAMIQRDFRIFCRTHKIKYAAIPPRLWRSITGKDEKFPDRVIAGLGRARERGVRLGRPHTQVDADRAKHLRENGWSYRRIGMELGVGTGTVYRALANPFAKEEKQLAQQKARINELAGAFGWKGKG